MDDPIWGAWRELPGRTIEAVLVVGQRTGMAPPQVRFFFTDGTEFEIYGDWFKGSGRVSAMQTFESALAQARNENYLFSYHRLPPEAPPPDRQE